MLQITILPGIRDIDTPGRIITSIETNLHRLGVQISHVPAEVIHATLDGKLCTRGGRVDRPITLIVDTGNPIVRGCFSAGQDSAPNRTVGLGRGNETFHVTVWGDVGDIDTVGGRGTACHAIFESGCLGHSHVAAGIIGETFDVEDLGVGDGELGAVVGWAGEGGCCWGHLW